MSKSKPTPETRLRLKAEIRDALIATAKTSQKTVSYSSLTKQINSLALTPRSHILYAVLTEISEEETAAGRGLLSAVVIRKDGVKAKNSGFIKLATRLGRDTADHVRFWNDEIESVCTYWRTH